MNRLLNTSSSTGSAVVPIAGARCGGSTRSSTRSPRTVKLARHPGSTTVVALCSRITAGPSITSPGRRSSRSNTAAQRKEPAVYKRMVLIGSSGRCRGANSGAVSSAECVRPTASTAIASTISGLPGIRKPYCARYLRSNSAMIAATGAAAISSAVSVPSYLRCSVRFALMRRSGIPCAATSPRAAVSSRSYSGITGSIPSSASRASTACCFSARTSASPIP